MGVPGGPRSGFVLGWEAPQLCLCVECRIVGAGQDGWLWAPGCTETPVEPGGAALICSAGKSTPTEPANVGSSLGNAGCPLRCAVFTGLQGLQWGQRHHVWPWMPLCTLCAPLDWTNLLCPIRGCSHTFMGQVGKWGAGKCWCALLRTSHSLRPQRVAAE